MDSSWDWKERDPLFSPKPSAESAPGTCVTDKSTVSGTAVEASDAGAAGADGVEGGGDMGIRIAAPLQVRTQDVNLDGAVVLALVPVAQVAIAKAAGPHFVREHGDHAVLREAFGAGQWRMKSEQLTPDLARSIRNLNLLYSRLSKEEKNKYSSWVVSQIGDGVKPH